MNKMEDIKKFKKILKKEKSKEINKFDIISSHIIPFLFVASIILIAIDLFTLGVILSSITLFIIGRLLEKLMPDKTSSPLSLK